MRKKRLAPCVLDFFFSCFLTMQRLWECALLIGHSTTVDPHYWCPFLSIWQWRPKSGRCHVPYFFFFFPSTADFSKEPPLLAADWPRVLVTTTEPNPWSWTRCRAQPEANGGGSLLISVAEKIHRGVQKFSQKFGSSSRRPLLPETVNSSVTT